MPVQDPYTGEVISDSVSLTELDDYKDISTDQSFNTDFVPEVAPYEEWAQENGLNGMSVDTMSTYADNIRKQYMENNAYSSEVESNLYAGMAEKATQLGIIDPNEEGALDKLFNHDPNKEANNFENKLNALVNGGDGEYSEKAMRLRSINKLEDPSPEMLAEAADLTERLTNYFGSDEGNKEALRSARKAFDIGLADKPLYKFGDEIEFSEDFKDPAKSEELKKKMQEDYLAGKISYSDYRSGVELASITDVKDSEGNKMTKAELYDIDKKNQALVDAISKGGSDAEEIQELMANRNALYATYEGNSEQFTRGAKQIGATTTLTQIEDMDYLISSKLKEMGYNVENDRSLKLLLDKQAGRALIQQRTMFEDPSEVHKNLRRDGFGAPIVGLNVMLNDEIFDATVNSDQSDITAEEKEQLKAEREIVLVENYDRINKVFNKSDKADKWIRHKHEMAKRGVSKVDSLKAFIGRDDVNRSFLDRVSSAASHWAEGTANMVHMAGLYLSSDGSKSQKYFTNAILENAEDAARRREVAEIFGQNWGMGQELFEVAGNVGIDLGISALLAIPTGGAGSAAYLGARTATKQIAKQVAKGVVKTATKELLESGVMKIGKRSLMGNLFTGTLKRGAKETGESFAERLVKDGVLKGTFSKEAGVDAANALAKVYYNNFGRKVGQNLATSMGAFQRSTSASYADAYNTIKELNPELTDEQIHDKAMGASLISGFTTSLLVFSFGSIGRGGIEQSIFKGASPRETKRIIERLSGAEKLTNGEFREVLKRQIRKTIGKLNADAGKNGTLSKMKKGFLDEASEEGLDQLIGGIASDAYIGDDRKSILDRAKEVGHASLLGGIMGSGSPAVTAAVNKLPSKQRASEQAIYGEAIKDIAKNTSDELRASGSVASAKMFENILGSRVYGDAKPPPLPQKSGGMEGAPVQEVLAIEDSRLGREAVASGKVKQFELPYNPDMESASSQVIDVEAEVVNPSEQQTPRGEEANATEDSGKIGKPVPEGEVIELPDRSPVKSKARKKKEVTRKRNASKRARRSARAKQQRYQKRAKKVNDNGAKVVEDFFNDAWFDQEADAPKTPTKSKNKYADKIGRTKAKTKSNKRKDTVPEIPNKNSRPKPEVRGVESKRDITTTADVKFEKEVAKEVAKDKTLEASTKEVKEIKAKTNSKVNKQRASKPEVAEKIETAKETVVSDLGVEPLTVDGEGYITYPNGDLISEHVPLIVVDGNVYEVDSNFYDKDTGKFFEFDKHYPSEDGKSEIVYKQEYDMDADDISISKIVTTKDENGESVYDYTDLGSFEKYYGDKLTDVDTIESTLEPTVTTEEQEDPEEQVDLETVERVLENLEKNTDPVSSSIVETEVTSREVTASEQLDDAPTVEDGELTQAEMFEDSDADPDVDKADTEATKAAVNVKRRSQAKALGEQLELPLGEAEAESQLSEMQGDHTEEITSISEDNETKSGGNDVGETIADSPVINDPNGELELQILNILIDAGYPKTIASNNKSGMPKRSDFKGANSTAYYRNLAYHLKKEIGYKYPKLDVKGVEQKKVSSRIEYIVDKKGNVTSVKRGVPVFVQLDSKGNVLFDNDPIAMAAAMRKGFEIYLPSGFDKTTLNPAIRVGKKTGKVFDVVSYNGTGTLLESVVDKKGNGKRADEDGNSDQMDYDKLSAYNAGTNPKEMFKATVPNQTPDLEETSDNFIAPRDQKTHITTSRLFNAYLNEKTRKSIDKYVKSMFKGTGVVNNASIEAVYTDMVYNLIHKLAIRHGVFADTRSPELIRHTQKDSLVRLNETTGKYEVRSNRITTIKNRIKTYFDPKLTDAQLLEVLKTNHGVNGAKDLNEAVTKFVELHILNTKAFNGGKLKPMQYLLKDAVSKEYSRLKTLDGNVEKNVVGEVDLDAVEGIISQVEDNRATAEEPVVHLTENEDAYLGRVEDTLHSVDNSIVAKLNKLKGENVSNSVDFEIKGNDVIIILNMVNNSAVEVLDSDPDISNATKDLMVSVGMYEVTERAALDLIDNKTLWNKLVEVYSDNTNPEKSLMFQKYLENLDKISPTNAETLRVALDSYGVTPSSKSLDFLANSDTIADAVTNLSKIGVNLTQEQVAEILQRVRLSMSGSLKVSSVAGIISNKSLAYNKNKVANLGLESEGDPVKNTLDAIINEDVESHTYERAVAAALRMRMESWISSPDVNLYVELFESNSETAGNVVMLSDTINFKVNLKASNGRSLNNLLLNMFTEAYTFNALKTDTGFAKKITNLRELIFKEFANNSSNKSRVEMPLIFVNALESNEAFLKHYFNSGTFQSALNNIFTETHKKGMFTRVSELVAEELYNGSEKNAFASSLEQTIQLYGHNAYPYNNPEVVGNAVELDKVVDVITYVAERQRVRSEVNSKVDKNLEKAGVKPKPVKPKQVVKEKLDTRAKDIKDAATEAIKEFKKQVSESSGNKNTYVSPTATPAETEQVLNDLFTTILTLIPNNMTLKVDTSIRFAHVVGTDLYINPLDTMEYLDSKTPMQRKDYIETVIREEIAHSIATEELTYAEVMEAAAEVGDSYLLKVAERYYAHDLGGLRKVKDLFETDLSDAKNYSDTDRKALEDERDIYRYKMIHEDYRYVVQRIVDERATEDVLADLNGSTVKHRNLFMKYLSKFIALITKGSKGRVNYKQSTIYENHVAKLVGAYRHMRNNQASSPLTAYFNPSNPEATTAQANEQTSDASVETVGASSALADSLLFGRGNGDGIGSKPPVDGKPDNFHLNESNLQTLIDIVSELEKLDTGESSVLPMNTRINEEDEGIYKDFIDNKLMQIRTRGDGYPIKKSGDATPKWVKGKVAKNFKVRGSDSEYNLVGLLATLQEHGYIDVKKPDTIDSIKVYTSGREIVSVTVDVKTVTEDEIESAVSIRLSEGLIYFNTDLTEGDYVFNQDLFHLINVNRQRFAPQSGLTTHPEGDYVHSGQTWATKLHNLISPENEKEVPQAVQSVFLADLLNFKPIETSEFREQIASVALTKANYLIAKNNADAGNDINLDGKENPESSLSLDKKTGKIKAASKASEDVKAVVDQVNSEMEMLLVLANNGKGKVSINNLVSTPDGRLLWSDYAYDSVLNHVEPLPVMSNLAQIKMQLLERVDLLRRMNTELNSPLVGGESTAGFDTANLNGSSLTQLLDVPIESLFHEFGNEKDTYAFTDSDGLNTFQKISRAAFGAIHKGDRKFDELNKRKLSHRRAVQDNLQRYQQKFLKLSVKYFGKNPTPDQVALIQRATGSTENAEVDAAFYAEVDSAYNTQFDEIAEMYNNGSINKETRDNAISAIKKERSDKIIRAKMEVGNKLREAKEQAIEELAEVAPELAEAIEHFRTEYVDQYSAWIKENYNLTYDMKGVFDANMGIYLTRTYRAFTTPNYIDQVLNDKDMETVREEAIGYFERRFLDTTVEKIMEDDGVGRSEAVVRARQLLEDKGENGMRFGEVAMIKFMNSYRNKKSIDATKGGDSSAALTDALMHRMDMPKELRALLGENTEETGFGQMLNTFAVLGSMATQHSFLRDIKTVGLRTGMFVTEAEAKESNSLNTGTEGDDTYVKLRVNKGSNPNDPLDGVYVLSNLAENIRGYLDAQAELNSGDIQGEIAQSINKTVRTMAGYSLMAKTVFGTGFHMRNIISNIGFIGGMNGFYRFDKSVKELFNGDMWKHFMNGADTNDALTELTALGVINNEIRSTIIKELNTGKSMSEIVTEYTTKKDSKNPLALAGKAVEAVGDKAIGMAQISDGFFKIAYFMNELQYLKKAQSNGEGRFASMSDTEIRVEAARIVRRTSQTASEAPAFLEKWSKSPWSAVFAAFARFSTEVYRMHINSVKQGIYEIKSDSETIRKRGYLRLAGATAVSVLVPAAISAASHMLAGMGYDEDKNFKKGLPEYYANSTFLYLGNKQYIDFTYLNPFMDLTNLPILAISAFTSTEGMTTDKLLELASSAKAATIGKFTDDNIAWGVLSDLRRNEDKRTGRSIYTEGDTDGDKFFKMLKFGVENAYEPDMIKRARMAYRIATDDTTQGFDPDNPYTTQDILLGRKVGDVRPDGTVVKAGKTSSKKWSDFAQGLAGVRVMDMDLSSTFTRGLRKYNAERQAVKSSMNYLMSDRPYEKSEIETRYKEMTEKVARIDAEMHNYMYNWKKIGLSGDEIGRLAVASNMGNRRTKMLVNGMMDRIIPSPNWWKTLMKDGVDGAAKAKELFRVINETSPVIELDTGDHYDIYSHR